MSPLTHEYLTIVLYGLPVWLVIGKVFFGSFSGFVDCLRWFLMPDVVSLLRGEWGEDQWATAKVFIYFAACGLAVYSAHQHFYPA